MYVVTCGLIDIGTRNLHICHNAFAKGLEMFGSSIVIKVALMV